MECSNEIVGTILTTIYCDGPVIRAVLRIKKRFLYYENVFISLYENSTNSVNVIITVERRVNYNSEILWCLTLRNNS